MFSDALGKIHFIRVSSQVPQGSMSNDNALPSSFGSFMHAHTIASLWA